MESDLKVEKIFLPGVVSKSFTNHKSIAGKSGAGKSNKCEFEFVQEVGDVKCIDLYDSGRFENACYLFEENNPYKVRRLLEDTNGKHRPRAFPCEFVMICGRHIEYMNELPGNCKEDVIDKKTGKLLHRKGDGVFLRSFRDEDLSLGDVTYLLGKSDALRGLLDYIANKMGENVSFDSIYAFLKRQRKMRSIPFYMIESVIRYIIRWKASGMFSKNVENINVKDSLMDKKRITSYSTYLLEPEEEPIVYAMILKQIWDLKKRRKIPHRIRIYIREMANFYTEGWELPRSYILRIQREGRDMGIDLMIDTQRPKDLPPKFRRQFGYHSQMKADLSDAEGIREIQEIPKEHLEKVPRFGVGESVLATGMRWDVPVLTPPTPHRHKEPWFDVLAMLKEEFGVVEYDVEKVLEYVEPEALPDEPGEDDEQEDVT